MKTKTLLLLLLCLGCASLLHSQTAKKTYTIKGVVYESETNTPLEMAYVTLPQFNLWATTDSKGAFTINRVASGTTEIEITCLGYRTINMVINVNRDIDTMTFKLQEESLKLQSVTVTATEVKSAINTTTRMERQAIEHLQVINPTDIMSLMPGGKTVNPNLMTQSIFSIRGGDANGSFGTAVEIDGVRLSSNSSLTNTTGVDTRNLSASNFESVEVITGVPSVEYGDMTSGMVVITTKKGRSPFNVSLSLNPTTKSASLSKGFELKKERGVINFNAEYAHAFSNPVSPYTTYFRNGYSLNYSNTFNREGRPLQFNANFGGSIGRQAQRQDPDAYKDIYSTSRDNAFRTGLSLNWLVNSPIITNLESSLSFSYKDDYQENNAYFSSPAIKPAVNSVESGYYETNYIPAQFYNLKMVDSKGLAVGFNLKANHNRKVGKVHNKIKAGIGYSVDGNVGVGEDYKDKYYPDGFRPRPYTDIPFVHNINAYLEDNLNLPIAQGNLSLIAGVRTEKTIIEGMDYKGALSASPRFNARYSFFEKPKRSGFLRSMSLRAGWGMMEKLPSFNVLYPMDKYRDIIVYSKNYGPDNKYFYVANTGVYRDTYNPDLKWSRSRNAELGVDFNLGGIAFTLVYYNNKSLSPYVIDKEYKPFVYKKSDENYNVGDNPKFRVDKITGDIYVTRPEITDPSSPYYGEKLIPTSVKDTSFIVSNFQTNGEPSTRQGVELTVDFGRIEAIRTSFRFDARYAHSKAVEERLVPSVFTGYPHSTLPSNQGRTYEFVAYYLGGTNRNTTYNGDWSDNLSTNLTATTHIPEIRMTLSFRLEGTIFSRSQNITRYKGKEYAFLTDNEGNRIPGSVYNQKEYYSGIWPVAYSGFDGVIKPFTEKEAADPRFALMIGKSNTVYRFARDGSWSYFMANISLTKEIGDIASLSFYVNNFTKSNPYLKSWATGLKSSRNIGFAYGASLRFKF